MTSVVVDFLGTEVLERKPHFEPDFREDIFFEESVDSVKETRFREEY